MAQRQLMRRKEEDKIKRVKRPSQTHYLKSSSKIAN